MFDFRLFGIKCSEQCKENLVMIHMSYFASTIYNIYIYFIDLRRSRDGTLFVCSAVRVFVNQIFASFSSFWPAVTLFT